MPFTSFPASAPARRRPGRLRRLAVVGAIAAAATVTATSAPAVAADSGIGQVHTVGAAGSFGAAPGRSITGLARSASGGGYWLASADGGVFAFGDAAFLGSAGGVPLRQPVVDIAATASGNGYWLTSRDGGVFAFGAAAYAGSVGDVRLSAPVVGVAGTPSGNGYWLVGGDGGVFAFGDAAFLGSAGGAPLNAPIVAIAATPTGNGYRLLASDGGVFAFGDAAYAGSPSGPGPFVDLAGTADGKGYWVASAAGAVRAFGSAPELGNGLATPPGAPVTALDATPSGDGLWLATGGVPLGDFGVTCYSLTGSTATGAPVSQAGVAVDPRAIPLGSEIFVDGLGVKRAVDTGGKIKGRRLDIWHPSAQHCREFGVRRLTAYEIG